MTDQTAGLPLFTRDQSYKEIQTELGHRQQEVFDKICQHSGGISNRQISKELGLEINQVTGRTNELVKKLKIEAGETMRDGNTNRRVVLWRRK